MYILPKDNSVTMPSEREEHTLLLSNIDVGSLVTFEDVVDAVERTWAEAAFGRVVNPPKLTLDLGESGTWPGYNAYMNAMPAYVGWLDSVGLKWAGGFWDNILKGRPSISAMILLVDARTGRFEAVIEGSLITALRTSAQTIVGIRYLAKKDLRSIGIYGAGTQARYHILMISKFFPSVKILLYDTQKGLAKDLLTKIKKEVNLDMYQVEQPMACSEADVIITLTTSKTPFLRGEWIRKGQTIAALGSYQEVYPEVIAGSDKIIVDNIQQSLHRGALKILSDKSMITEKDIFATIGEIVAGQKPGRERDEEVIFFEPIGTGMLDVAVATIVYNKAIQKGVGEGFKFFRF